MSIFHIVNYTDFGQGSEISKKKNMGKPCHSLQKERYCFTRLPVSMVYFRNWNQNGISELSSLIDQQGIFSLLSLFSTEISTRELQLRLGEPKPCSMSLFLPLSVAEDFLAGQSMRYECFKR